VEAPAAPDGPVEVEGDGDEVPTDPSPTTSLTLHGGGAVLPTSAAAKYRRGSENENIGNIGENIGKYRKMS
jgi:hypothetical protein